MYWKLDSSVWSQLLIKKKTIKKIFPADTKPVTKLYIIATSLNLPSLLSGCTPSGLKLLARCEPSSCTSPMFPLRPMALLRPDCGLPYYSSGAASCQVLGPTCLPNAATPHTRCWLPGRGKLARPRGGLRCWLRPGGTLSSVIISRWHQHEQQMPFWPQGPHREIVYVRMCVCVYAHVCSLCVRVHGWKPACCSRQGWAIYYLPTYQAISLTQLGKKSVDFIPERPFSPYDNVITRYHTHAHTCSGTHTGGDKAAFSSTDRYLFFFGGGANMITWEMTW